MDDEDEKIYFDMTSKKMKVDVKEFSKELDNYAGLRYRVE